MGGRLFPAGLPHLEWLEFAAEGYPHNVPGVIFAADQASSGVPLGGIGTGCIDLNTDGTFGRSSIFNSFVPPRVLDLPFAALNAGDHLFSLSTTSVSGAVAPKQIEYWGHYPIADLEYTLDAPISLGLRAWSPFILGDADVSNTPAACFEFHIRNLTNSVTKGNLIFAFPGPTEEESGSREYRHNRLGGPVRGVSVTTERGFGYALGLVGEVNPRIGGNVDIHSGGWTSIAAELPAISSAQPGCSLVANYELDRTEEKIIRVVLAWYWPRWAGSFAHHYWHAYRKRFKDAKEVAEFLGHQHTELLLRIVHWQTAVYGSRELPAWLRDQLINVLHTISEDSFWAGDSFPAQKWYGHTGIFGLTESPRTTPHICNPSDWYGNLPIVFFFPDLGAALLRAYTHYQLPDGEIPLGFGEHADLASPTYQIIHTLNSFIHVHLVDRLWQRDLNEGVLREFYPSVVRAMNYTMQFDHDGDGLIELDPDPIPNHYYGAWFWYGISVYVNGLWLAALAMSQRMAESVDDYSTAEDVSDWRARATQSLEQKLWRDEAYLLYSDPQTARSSDTVLANQLAGEWCAKLHCLPGVFRNDHVLKALSTVKRVCMPLTPAGIVDAARRDGRLDHSGTPQSDGIFTGESVCVAAIMAYCEDATTALEIARRLFETIVLQERRPWDLPNILDSSGRAIHGTDFYQNMVLWALPLSLARQSIHQACSEGSIVNRILQAASSSNSRP
jgi:uncharacterized protein (DUF608 family)